MNARQWLLVGISTLIVLATTAALAQGPGMRQYDPKTEVKVLGTVEDVQQQNGRHGWSGTHLILKTDSETLDVHLGPSSFLAQKGFSFAKGDKLEVTGSRVKMNGKDTLIAREITKDGKSLVLRNAQGVPEWSGGQRRTQ